MHFVEVVIRSDPCRRDPFLIAHYEKELDEEGEWKNAGGIQAMPIHSPVNWDQIWYDWDDIGRDYEKPLAANMPLSADQLEQMHNYANQHGRVRNIKFIQPVGQGNKQATGMTKISRGGGYFRKIFGQGGGIFPEVFNFDRKSRF